MPARPAYFHRITEALEVLRKLESDWIDRRTLEETLGGPVLSRSRGRAAPASARHLLARARQNRGSGMRWRHRGLGALRRAWGIWTQACQCLLYKLVVFPGGDAARFEIVDRLAPRESLRY